MLLWDGDVSQNSVLSVPSVENTAIMSSAPLLQPQSAESMWLQLSSLIKSENFWECWDFNEFVFPLNMKSIYLEFFSILNLFLNIFHLETETLCFHIPHCKLNWMPQTTFCSLKVLFLGREDPCFTRRSFTSCDRTQTILWFYVTCVRASAGGFQCSICKILHVVTHTFINICAPKMRPVAGSKASLGAPGLTQHPLGGAGALQFPAGTFWGTSAYGGTECCLVILGKLRRSSLGKLLS